MKIYIELVIVFVLVSFLILWKVWVALSKRLLSKKYKPDDDKSKKGELNRRAVEREESTIGTTVTTSSGHEQPEERRGLLPKAEVSVVRKNCSGVRGILKRRRRKY